MKLILFLSFLSLCVLCQKPLKLSQAAQMNQMIPSTSIPTIHPEDNWMFGSLAAPLPRIYNSPITHSYEEMLSNPKKRLISLGVNNSGTIDLNKSIIIDAEPRYVFDDGVLGTLSPVHKPMRKLPLTEQYEEMLKDTQKKLISLGVNSSAFYDPDNQVIMQGTENVNPLNVLGKSLADMQEENKKTKKKMASFLEDSPRFEQKNENMNDSNIHSFIIDKYGKMMKFLQMFNKKENHTVEEMKLLSKIKNYEKMIQRMSYLKKYPNDKEYVNSLADQLNEMNPAPADKTAPVHQSFRFNNIDPEEQAESQQEQLETQEKSEVVDEPSPNQNKKKEVKDTLNHLSNVINKEISKDLKHKKTKITTNLQKPKHKNKYKQIQNELSDAIPQTEENSQFFNIPGNELSINYQFTKNQEAKELATIENLIKNGERDQEAASKRLSILKSLLNNKKNRDISKKEVIFSEIEEQVRKLNEDVIKKEEKKLVFDLHETKNFLKKRTIDKNFKMKFKEMIQNILEKDLPKNDYEEINKNIKIMMEMSEGKQLKVDNKNLKYNEVAKKIESTENNVENGKLYEAEENLSEINDLLNPKGLSP